MASRVQDIVLGIALLMLAAVWTWLVVATIQPGFGDGEIGPRAFPLFLGIVLLALAALLLVLQFLRPRDAGRNPGGGPRLRWLPALAVLAEIALFGFLMEKIGFLLATPVVVFLVMFVSLGVRSAPKLVGMSLGLTIGCWLIFEKVLGIYLANGLWINVG